MSAERSIRVRGEADVAEATRAARDLALASGLGRTEAVQLATAVSEIAGNQIRHARGGTVTLAASARGVTIVAADDGPGIADVGLALTDGWSTADSLGLGLPGARRLVDEFDLETAPGRGTRVTMSKWRADAVGALAPGELAHWAVSVPEGARWTAVATPSPAGLVVAVARSGERALRREPAVSPSALVDAVGGRDVAVALLSGMDAQLSWRAEPPATAVLRRDRHAAAGPHLVVAPRGRSATLGVLRDDLLVLASFAVAVPPTGTPAEVAAEVARAGPRGGVVVAARMRRGVHERRPAAR